jgi:hypothetical protein
MLGNELVNIFRNASIGTTVNINISCLLSNTDNKVIISIYIMLF